MIKRYMLCLLVLGVLLPDVSGQGFAGKKLVIGYNHRFLPALNISGDFASYRFVRTGKRGMNHINGLEALLVLDRTNTIGVTGSFYRAGVLQFSSNPINTLIDAYSVGFMFRKYFSGKGAIAPVGNWLQLEVSQHQLIGTGIDQNFNILDEQFRQGITDFRIGLGKTTVLFNNVLIDFGAEMAYPLWRVNPETSPLGCDPTCEAGISRLFLFHLYNIRIGISLPIL
ncbi:MAG: hypothetical protein AAF206_15550 [Bacteroidota bacterium]